MPARRPPLLCRITDHHWRFLVEGSSLVWICERCGHEGGPRQYSSPQEAHRYARRLNRGGDPPTGLLAALAGTVVRRPGKPR